MGVTLGFAGFMAHPLFPLSNFRSVHLVGTRFTSRPLPFSFQRPIPHQQSISSAYRTMATEAAFANLPPPARELVTKLSTSSLDALGRTGDEKIAVSGYIASVAQGKYALESVNLEVCRRWLPARK